MIEKSTLSFLSNLAQNNDRNWFEAHRADYEQARANVIDFTGKLITLLSEKDPNIGIALPVKDCLTRIYRDVRFRLDKTPYKNNFSIGISPTGKNFSGPGYWLEITPNASFIGIGCWMPNPEQLRAIRQEIDYQGDELQKILSSKPLNTYFKGLDTIFGQSLKKAPKGYLEDNPRINWLKMKSFILSKQLTDDDLTQANSAQHIATIFAAAYPFVQFLRTAINT